MLRIVPATAERLQPALELLYSELPADARAQRIAELRQEIEDEEFETEHLLVAEIDAQLVAVQRTILRDDDVGLVWPPVINAPLLKFLNGPSSEVIEDKLLTEAARHLDAAGAWIGQALLEAKSSREHAAMQRNGFARLTELRFFERPLTAAASCPKRTPEPSMSYQPYRRSRNQNEFVKVLEATYRGSLDCPELNGVRDGQQSLKNHAAAGSFHSDMWRLYRCAGEDVGILLMAKRPDQQAWEVLYLGVVESARGRGIGRAMLLDALDAARDLKLQRLLIVADVRNIPAVSLYESLGFQPVSTRVAFVRLAPPLPRDRTHDAAGQ